MLTIEYEFLYYFIYLFLTYLSALLNKDNS